MAEDATLLNHPGKISEDQVENFLRDHPDFLTQHPALLDVMTPPMRWSGDKVVDMQTFMLDRLRGEQVDLKDAANLLISTTRANMMIQTRTHAAVIALLGAEGLEKLIHATCFDLPLLLDVDAVSLCFEKGDKEYPGLGNIDIRWFAPGTIDTVLSSSEDFRSIRRPCSYWSRWHVAGGFARTRLPHTGGVPRGPGNGSVDFSRPGA